MVAVVTGQGLGVERGSSFVLGSRGQLGSSIFNRYGENVYVNAATGNLAIQRQDELLIGRGLDDDVSRSYNSLGTGLDDNGDNWQLSQSRRVTGLTGTVNSAGSTITRYDWDGSDTVYAWDASRNAYLSTAGSGAYDTLTFASNVWTWTDGGSRQTETYDALNAGRITTAKDADSNALTFTYTGSLLTRVTTWNGEHTDYSYSGNNLTQVVSTRSDGTTETRVRYTYDTSNRLSTVTTDLSPTDNAVTDGNAVTTTYSYDGTSRRVTTIAQTGGARLSIAYTLVGADYRVQTLTQTPASGVTSTTSFSYDTVNRVTTVTDAQNNVTRMTYDAAGNLTRLEQPAPVSGAATLVSSFVYDGNGNVTAITDQNGNQTAYSYDGNGNLTLSRDAAGNTVTYTYDANNNRLTQTRYLVPDPDGAGGAQPGTPVTTRYAYDAENHLVYSVSDEGRVTRYDYNTPGQVTREAVYATILYDTSALGASASLSQATLDAWTATIGDKSGFQITDTNYDARGGINTINSYTTTDANGGGLTTTTYNRTTYVYDQAGNLLSVHDKRTTNAQTYIYDGLNRLIGSTDLAGGSTSIVFTDASNTTVVTATDGSTTTTIDDHSGEILTTRVAGSDITTMTTLTAYDNLGQLRMMTNALGQMTYFLYDDAGRKVADITADGALTEYAYDAGGRLARTIQYATKLTSAQIASLVSAGRPADIELSAVRPPASGNDSSTWNIYDKADRLVESINAVGSATVYSYDGADRLVQTTAYATPINLASLNGNTVVLPAADSTRDRTTRYFYSDDGLQVGTLDGDGALTQTAYDAAGRQVRTIAYASFTTSGLRASGTLAQLLASVAGNAADRQTDYVYDNESELRYTIEDNSSAALGTGSTTSRLTEYGYDLSGNLLHTLVYGAPIAAPASNGVYSLAYVQGQISSLGLASNAANRMTHSVYDNAGRLAFAIDALGGTTQFVYDAAGRVTKTIGFSSLRPSSGDLTVDSWQSWATTHVGDADNRIGYTLFDAVSRPIYQIDAEGYVTESQYDRLSRVAKTIRYPASYAVDDTTTTASLKATIGSAPATAVTTTMVYDTAGRLTDITNGVGAITHYVYDALGRVTDMTVAYGTADAATTHSTYDQAGRQLSTTAAYGTAEAATTHYTYDALGNLLYETDAAYEGTYNYKGTFFVYDNLGHLTAQVYVGLATMEAGDVDAAWYYAQYPDVAASGMDAATHYHLYGWKEGRNPNADFNTNFYLAERADVAAGGVDPLTHFLDSGWAEGSAPSATVSVYQYFQRHTTGTDVTRYSYDTFGNRLTVTNPTGGVTTSYYNQLDQLVLQVDPMGYATTMTYSLGGAVQTVTRYATPGSGTPNVATPPAITANAGEDATTSFTLDKLDRVTTATDAMGYYEQYTLNAFGDRVSVRNKLGGVTTNVFNRRGLLTSETLPQSSVLANGNLQASTVTNSFAYDARGNRIQMVEAAGLAEARTTTYGYDKMDRLISTSHDAVYVTDSSTLVTATSASIPTETIKYDLRGNVIEQKDAAGARTLSYYDHGDNRIAQISPNGTLSAWTYDDSGNVLTATIYGDLVALPSAAGGNPPAPVNAANNHQTSYSYDKDGRLLSSTVLNILTGAFNGGSYATTTSSLTATNLYDAAGNLVRSVDANGANSYFFYDRSGRKVAEVDAGNYLTTWVLDADGNVTSETRYATALSGTFSNTSDWTALRSQAAAGSLAANDRTTSFTYDRNGNRLTETRANVVAWTVNATNGALSQASTSATVTYAYNGLGEVTSKQEATGDVTLYSYDTAGRQTQVRNAAFLDYNGTSTQRVTSNFYDGLGDLARTTVTGSAGSPGTRITTYAYGAGGRLASVTDAAGFTTSYGYDITGRTVKAQYSRSKSDGSSVTEAQATGYDLEGRTTYQSIATLSGSTWIFGDSSQTQYDAYGQAVAKGVDGLWQQSYVYDGAGRVSRATQADGTTQLYVYDKAGNITLTITSGSTTSLGAPADLSGQSVQGALNLLTGNGAHAVDAVSQNSVGMLVTIGVFDARGQQTQVRLPFRDLSTTTTGGYYNNQQYNAFGEVTQTIDSRGGVTDYSYNSEGKIVSSQAPTASWTSENGTIASGRATQTNYYDLSGRLVGVRDANNNLNTLSLRAGTGYGGDEADTLKEFHADGGIIQKAYDVFGDLRTSRNEVGQSESYLYDNMNRLTEQDHQQRADGTQLKDYYAYDQLGQRTQHWNSQLGSSVKETSDYDAQGRVTSMVDLGGDTTSYNYVWSSSIATTGMATYGGWTKTTVNAAGLTETEALDVFGHEAAKTDFGNHNYAYSYDKAGRETLETNSAGENVATSYFNTGLTATITSGNLNDSAKTGSSQISSYGYDANGNELSEKVITSSWVNAVKSNYTDRDALATWDANNRMLSFHDNGDQGTTSGNPASITWEYDLNGNVRHTAASYRDVLSGSTLSQDYWYKYDSMNRFVTTKGSFSGARGSGTIGRGTTGVDVSYDAAGERITETSTIQGSGYFDNPNWDRADPSSPQTIYANYSYDQRTEYGYSADGYLATVKIASGAATMDGNGNLTVSAPPATPTLRTAYVRDAMSRVTSYSEYDTNGTTVNYSRTDAYNARSQITSETTSARQQDGTTLVATTAYDYVLSTNASVWNGTSHGTYNGAYQGGVVTHTLTTNTRINTNGTSTTLARSETESAYGWWDDAQITHKGSWPDVNATVYTSDYTRDATGQLTRLLRNEASSGQVTYTLDAQGHVSARRETATGSSAVATDYSYFFGGVLLGRTGNNGPDADDYALAVGQLQAQPVRSGPFAGGGTQAYANFDESYDPINPESQDQTSGTYTVSDGETLTSIAQTVWGDGALWYLIADANGLSGSETLAAGRDLTIPSKVTNIHNNSSTYRVYDPNQAQGQTDPIAPSPKPAKHNHCGAFGQILLVAVAVAVTVVTSGAAAAATLPGAASIGTGLAALAAGQIGLGTAIAIGAGAAALGSVVSQGVGIATGIQDKFSFTGVALSALAGGIGASFGGGPFGKIAGSPFLGNVAGGAIADGLIQGIALATGLQSHFSWSEIAAAGIGNGVGDSVHLPGGIYADRAVGAIAGAGASSLVSGSDFGDTLIRTLPSAIGQTIGNLAAGAIASAGHGPAGGQGSGQSGGQTGAGDGSAVQPQAGAGGGQVGRSASSGGSDGGDSSSTLGEIVVTADRSERDALWAMNTYQWGQYTSRAGTRYYDDLTAGWALGLTQPASAVSRVSSIAPGTVSHLLGMDGPNNWSYASLQGPITTMLRALPMSMGGTANGRDYAPGVLEHLNQQAAYRASIQELNYRLGETEQGLGAAIAGSGIPANASRADFDRSVAFGHIGDQLLMVTGGLAGAEIPGAGNQTGLTPAADISLTYKPGWSAEQIAEADVKVQILNSANTVVTSTMRGSTSPRAMFEEYGGEIPAGSDADHVIDLQLGGADAGHNIWPLNSSVNRSLGAQIQQQIRNLPPGTVINRVTIGNR